MEDKIEISGTWSGELTYGEEYGPDLQNKKLKFRLILKEDEGDITGECIDTGGTGIITEPASINGFIEDDMISFVKQYPTFYIIDPKGENGTFEGDWHVVYEIKQLTFGFAEYALSGTWMMKREN
jgi:hypothetical protein